MIVFDLASLSGVCIAAQVTNFRVGVEKRAGLYRSGSDLESVWVDRIWIENGRVRILRAPGVNFTSIPLDSTRPYLEHIQW